MSTKHTPGPWTFNGMTTITAQDDLICIAGVEMPDWQKMPDEAMERQANARLIAAAPQLLEACKAAARGLRGLRGQCDAREWREDWQNLPACLDTLESAIKAGGGE